MTGRILREPALLAGIAFNAGLLVLAILLLLAGNDHFTRFTREDAFVEWMQFLVFTALGMLLLFAAYDRCHRPPPRLLPLLGLGGFAASVLFAAGEEVSWFQRVLNMDTPEFFLKHNRQGEANIHNLMIGDVSVHKDIMVKLTFVAGMTHNLILPALALKRPAIRARVEAWGLYLPPLPVAIVTILLIVIVQVVLKHPRAGEVTELVAAVHYLVTAGAAYLIGVNYNEPVFRDATARARVSVLIVLCLGFLVLVAWLLAAGSALRAA